MSRPARSAHQVSPWTGEVHAATAVATISSTRRARTANGILVRLLVRRGSLLDTARL
jgi:hypothetical protein